MMRQRSMSTADLMVAAACEANEIRLNSSGQSASIDCTRTNVPVKDEGGPCKHGSVLLVLTLSGMLQLRVLVHDQLKALNALLSDSCQRAARCSSNIPAAAHFGHVVDMIYLTQSRRCRSCPLLRWRLDRVLAVLLASVLQCAASVVERLEVAVLSERVVRAEAGGGGGGHGVEGAAPQRAAHRSQHESAQQLQAHLTHDRDTSAAQSVGGGGSEWTGRRGPRLGGVRDAANGRAVRSVCLLR